MESDAILLAALRNAPRRYRLPPLPASVEAARVAGVDTALAFAIEAARSGKPAPAVRDLFTESIAALIVEALAPTGGDPAFQALVLRSREAQVAEYVQLAAQADSDQRALRTSVDAIAHPGKLRAMPAGPRRDALARLHKLATAGAWSDLREAAAQLSTEAAGEPLDTILAQPGLARLERGAALLRDEAVHKYLALGERQGPRAGSAAAAVRGRAAARVGDAAEGATVQAFDEIARLLGAGHRVARSLRTPRGFPGAAEKAKDEWDVAMLRDTDIVLLAEVKASPTAASSDLARLLRGLRRLAHADPDTDYAFPCADGEARIAGASLRQLQPRLHALPPQVIYCCVAEEARPQMLSAASKAVLLTEPACLAFARGELHRHQDLAPVWEALTTQPRLRSALHQDETARTVREAMLHPQDLLAAARQQLP